MGIGRSVSECVCVHVAHGFCLVLIVVEPQKYEIICSVVFIFDSPSLCRRSAVRVIETEMNKKKK